MSVSVGKQCKNALKRIRLVFTQNVFTGYLKKGKKKEKRLPEVHVKRNKFKHFKSDEYAKANVDLLQS